MSRRVRMGSLPAGALATCGAAGAFGDVVAGTVTTEPQLLQVALRPAYSGGTENVRPQPAQARGEGVARGVAVLVDEPDLAQCAQDAVGGRARQVQRGGDLGEGERAPRAAEQAQHCGGTFDRLDGSGHRVPA